ncbi:hypothetical protein Tco_1392488 [Tanacetum coccineum]
MQRRPASMPLIHLFMLFTHIESGKARRKARIVLSDDEEVAEDSSKQGRKISQINEDPTISLVQDEGISWIPQEEEVFVKPSVENVKYLYKKRLPLKLLKNMEVVRKKDAKDKEMPLMEEKLLLKEDGDIDSFFNGYYRDSSSDDEDANSVNGMDETHGGKKMRKMGVSENYCLTGDNFKEISTSNMECGVKDKQENMSSDTPDVAPNSYTNHRKIKRYSSLKLIDPILGIRRVSTQPQKNQKKKIKKTTILSQPITSNSFNNDETVEISDSFSKINRCNTRNFSKPSVSMESPSNEVENTIILGKKVGFDMEGKDHEIASVIANGDNMVDQ